MSYINPCRRVDTCVSGCCAVQGPESASIRRSIHLTQGWWVVMYSGGNEVLHFPGWDLAQSGREVRPAE